jgi:hypothetical protein
VGVPTSICAFVGRAARGPVGTPVEVGSSSDFAEEFGGLWEGSTLGFCVRDFFVNGGSRAVVVRVVGAGSGRALLRRGGLTLAAVDPGAWGNELRIRVAHDPPAAGADPQDAPTFTLTVRDGGSGEVEVHPGVTVGVPGHARELGAVLLAESFLVRVVADGTGAPLQRPPQHADPATGQDPWAAEACSTGVAAGDLGSDGDPLGPSDLLGIGDGSDRAGLYALADCDLFTLLVLAPDLPAADVDPAVVSAAHAYCERRRAFLLVDAPSHWRSAEDAISADRASAVGRIGANAALYFPRLRMPNPLHDDQVEDFPAVGALAGVLARMDAREGVWRAPAGLDADLVGVPEVALALESEEIGRLSRIGINCLWSGAPNGPVVWGARTAADDTEEQWRYLPVRRTAQFVEESLERGTRWAAFEPSGEHQWAALRHSAEEFLLTCWREGAFQGASPNDAFFVQCDRSTTSRSESQRGIVNLVVGFAAVRPAEFVVVRIRQEALSTPHP